MPRAERGIRSGSGCRSRPAALWLPLLFVVPFYAILSGLRHDRSHLRQRTRCTERESFRLRPAADLLRGTTDRPPTDRDSIVSAAILCLSSGILSPLSRYGGWWKAPPLTPLIAPFWISCCANAGCELLGRRAGQQGAAGGGAHRRPRPRLEGAHHGHPRPGVRLHPVHDPAAGLGRSTDRLHAGGGSRPWRQLVSTFTRRVTLPLSKQAIWLARSS